MVALSLAPQAPRSCLPLAPGVPRAIVLAFLIRVPKAVQEAAFTENLRRTLRSSSAERETLLVLGPAVRPA
eukprot:3603060-Pyramimonas_sp.AAC.1